MATHESDLDVLAQASAAAALSVSVKDNIANLIDRKALGRKRCAEFMSSIGADTLPDTAAGYLARGLLKGRGEHVVDRWRWALKVAKKANDGGFLGPQPSSYETAVELLNSHPNIRNFVVPVVVSVLREVNVQLAQDNQDIPRLTEIHKESETLCKMLCKK